MWPGAERIILSYFFGHVILSRVSCIPMKNMFEINFILYIKINSGGVKSLNIKKPISKHSIRSNIILWSLAKKECLKI